MQSHQGVECSKSTSNQGLQAYLKLIAELSAYSHKGAICSSSTSNQIFQDYLKLMQAISAYSHQGVQCSSSTGIQGLHAYYCKQCKVTLFKHQFSPGYTWSALALVNLFLGTVTELRDGLEFPYTILQEGYRQFKDGLCNFHKHICPRDFTVLPLLSPPIFFYTA